MKYVIRVEITLKEGLHDPEGSVALSCLRDLGFKNILDVKSGKVYYIVLEANNDEEAISIVDNACRKLLSNPVKDNYRIEIVHKY